ncbi:alpha/beta hydrolase [Corynebacterium felinum]|uniref:Pimeloyl-ACP methyl ester carboxylesterase n=1 Tax=Corynebacterium felinum TaxID=131318 RepID=A0ABU2BFW3_9CORY|nr:alpha/beta hydrolase [Corynebacterium felinum]MDF5821198.1 alpha/beta hydrolase [Corynebacterium felinum]MDR7356284.1 pimeloyl-ACP methyl ester carboxylesterase [Corynebacterium felinum]WJY95617.1 AB hydrolase superfamily protein YdjP [Corynebacterium felinum]
MVLSSITKKFRAWRIARNTRHEEFKPPQFSRGSRVEGLRYYIEGDDCAPVTVVFVHGYTLAASSWHFQIASIAEDARCIAVDLRGHGKSAEVAVADCSIDGAADDVMTVLDDAEVTGPVVFVGHSMGGMVVLNLLRRYPQFRVNCAGVVLISTSAQPFATGGAAKLLQLPFIDNIRDVALDNPDEVEALRDKVKEIVVPLLSSMSFAAETTDGQQEHHVKMINDTPLSTLVGFIDDLEHHDESEALQCVSNIPARVLVGGSDAMTPVSQSDFICQNWPHAQLRVVDGAGHMLPMEQPAIVNATITSLLKEVEVMYKPH